MVVGSIISGVMQALLIGILWRLYPSHNFLGPEIVAFIFAFLAYWIGAFAIAAQQRRRCLQFSDKLFIWLGYPALCVAAVVERHSPQVCVAIFEQDKRSTVEHDAKFADALQSIAIRRG